MSVRAQSRPETSTAIRRNAPRQTGQSVYQALCEHQQTDETWELKPLLAFLHRWAERFGLEFILHIRAISLRVDGFDPRSPGRFHPDHNGFGLVGEAALNRRYLADRPAEETLATLLHQLIHAWQQVHGQPSGKSSDHNREFRDKARDCGSVVDKAGHTAVASASAFSRLLDRHGLDDFPGFPPEPNTSKTKLKKWSCCCNPPINVRVAVPEFRARCMICGKLFGRVDETAETQVGREHSQLSAGSSKNVVEESG